MGSFCYKCSAELQLSGGKVARGDSCDSCRSDMHVCLNCKHFDRSAYNECREPQAERVLDKDRANFCDYFSILEGARGAAGKGGPAAKKDPLKALDDLFKR